MLLEHLNIIAAFCHGYTRQEVVDLGTAYPIQLGLRDKANPLIFKGFRWLIGRWPETTGDLWDQDCLCHQSWQLFLRSQGDYRGIRFWQGAASGFSQCRTPPSVVCSGALSPKPWQQANLVPSPWLDLEIPPVLQYRLSPWKIVSYFKCKNLIRALSHALFRIGFIYSDRTFACEFSYM